MATALDQICNHLEFLGYEIDRVKEEFILARHQKHANFALKIHGFGALAAAIYEVSEDGKRQRADFMERLNFYNNAARVCRAYLDKNSDLLIEAVFPNLYDRTAFGVFIELFNDDIRLLFIGDKNLTEYLS
jgi:hypothetical protein